MIKLLSGLDIGQKHLPRARENSCKVAFPLTDHPVQTATSGNREHRISRGFVQRRATHLATWKPPFHVLTRRAPMRGLVAETGWRCRRAAWAWSRSTRFGSDAGWRQ